MLFSNNKKMSSINEKSSKIFKKKTKRYMNQELVVFYQNHRSLPKFQFYNNTFSFPKKKTKDK